MVKCDVLLGESAVHLDNIVQWSLCMSVAFSPGLFSAIFDIEIKGNCSLAG